MPAFALPMLLISRRANSTKIQIGPCFTPVCSSSLRGGFSGILSTCHFLSRSSRVLVGLLQGSFLLDVRIPGLDGPGLQKPLANLAQYCPSYSTLAIPTLPLRHCPPGDHTAPPSRVRAFLTPWCEIANPRSCIAIAMVRRLLHGKKLGRLHCKVRSAQSWRLSWC